MPTSKYSFKGAKVLVAEDNEFSREILLHMLKVFDIEPDLVEDGLQVLEKVTEVDYDLLILDIHMPEKNGIEAASEIRKLGIHQPVILALTASVLKDEMDEAMASGFDGYISKPISLEGIEELLIKYLSDKAAAKD